MAPINLWKPCYAAKVPVDPQTPLDVLRLQEEEEEEGGGGEGEGEREEGFPVMELSFTYLSKSPVYDPPPTNQVSLG
jgi:hypothetical protein